MFSWDTNGEITLLRFLGFLYELFLLSYILFHNQPNFQLSPVWLVLLFRLKPLLYESILKLFKMLFKIHREHRELNIETTARHAMFWPNQRFIFSIVFHQTTNQPTDQTYHQLPQSTTLHFLTTPNPSAVPTVEVELRHFWLASPTHTHRDTESQTHTNSDTVTATQRDTLTKTHVHIEGR